MNAMIETVKEVHKEDVCLFKIGSFYHTYGRDAYILSYMFGYKVKNIGESPKECGFPINVVSKIKARLENNKINYLVIDNRNNFEVDEKSDNGNLNRYSATYEKARNYINYKVRIDGINNFLLENLEKKDFRKLLGKIEEIIYEDREVQSNWVYKESYFSDR